MVSQARKRQLTLPMVGNEAGGEHVKVCTCFFTSSFCLQALNLVISGPNGHGPSGRWSRSLSKSLEVCLPFPAAPMARIGTAPLVQ